MYGREKRVLLRQLLKQGLAKTAVSEKLGVRRRTVYHSIETGQLDGDLDDEAVRYRPRPPIPRKVDPYRGIIHCRLEEFPELSAVRLYEEIRAAGYEGGYTQVKEYVRQVSSTAGNRAFGAVRDPPGDTRLRWLRHHSKREDPGGAS